MARHFLSNCRRASALVLLAAFVPLAGCETTPETRPVFERWPSNGAGRAAPYLLALREYLAQPPGAQAAHRDRLRAAAERGGDAAQLEYALALSVDRDDRETLEAARNHFERLLAAPDPLPVALDALVRLQLGQVLDRLERMQASGDIHQAYRAAATGQKVCLAQLDDATVETRLLRAELDDVKRKLDALARIEQTVNESQRPPTDRNDKEDDDNEERPPDPAR